MSLVRPLPWARAVVGMRFTPDRWGPGVFRIAAPGGSHLLVRRHGAPELTLWLPAELAPGVGEAFGFYQHADRQHADRVRAASLLVWMIGGSRQLVGTRHAIGHRQAAMLCIHDMMHDGAALRDVAAVLLDMIPENWRTSSERSDLRRLVVAGKRMIAGDYRSLLARSAGTVNVNRAQGIDVT